MCRGPPDIKLSNHRKTRSDNVKCVLCSGNHPASYKGCTVYKQLQRSKYPPLRARDPNRGVSQKILTSKDSFPQTSSGTPQASYAYTTSQNFIHANIMHQTQTKDEVQEHDNASNNEIMVLLKDLRNQMVTMTNLMTNLIAKMSLHSTR